MPHPATIHMGNIVASTIEGQHAAGTSYNRVFRCSTGELRQPCVLARDTHLLTKLHSYGFRGSRAESMLLVYLSLNIKRYR